MKVGSSLITGTPSEILPWMNTKQYRIPKAGLGIITLGGALTRLRKVSRDFRKRATLMDEIRETTRKPEFNGRSLKVKLDCKTRWSFTLLMIERALRILPALNNVLSRYGTPMSVSDTLALERIAAVLQLFKRTILLLCKTEATLEHAVRVLSLLLRDLREIGTELAENLRENLKLEIVKRRTILSTALASLES